MCGISNGVVFAELLNSAFRCSTSPMKASTDDINLVTPSCFVLRWRRSYERLMVEFVIPSCIYVSFNLCRSQSAFLLISLVLMSVHTFTLRCNQQKLSAPGVFHLLDP